MFSIGEFSKITGMTVKTLRFYHEQGILVPARVETGSGYRLYSTANVETAKVISSLRLLQFSIAEITEILSRHQDDASLVSILESQRSKIRDRISTDRQLVRQLELIITHEKEASQMSKNDYQVELKEIDALLVASTQVVGKYSDCGIGFGKIGRRFGRYICGKPMMLCHDTEYREEDANFEVAMPIKRGAAVDDIQVKQLPGGPCISLMHLGPYDELGRSYERILRFAKVHGHDYAVPTREVYHKGPGMIFRGNPRKYLTEIQLMLSES